MVRWVNGGVEKGLLGWWIFFFCFQFFFGDDGVVFWIVQDSLRDFCWIFLKLYCRDSCFSKDAGVVFGWTIRELLSKAKRAPIWDHPLFKQHQEAFLRAVFDGVEARRVV